MCQASCNAGAWRGRRSCSCRTSRRTHAWCLLSLPCSITQPLRVHRTQNSSSLIQAWEHVLCNGPRSHLCRILWGRPHHTCKALPQYTGKRAGLPNMFLCSSAAWLPRIVEQQCSDMGLWCHRPRICCCSSQQGLAGHRALPPGRQPGSCSAHTHAVARSACRRRKPTPPCAGRSVPPHRSCGI